MFFCDLNSLPENTHFSKKRHVFFGGRGGQKWQKKTIRFKYSP